MSATKLLSDRIKKLSNNNVLNINKLTIRGTGAVTANINTVKQYSWSKTIPKIYANNVNEDKIYLALDILGKKYDRDDEIKRPKITKFRGRTPKKITTESTSKINSLKNIDYSTIINLPKVGEKILKHLPSSQLVNLTQDPQFEYESLNVLEKYKIYILADLSNANVNIHQLKFIGDAEQFLYLPEFKFLQYLDLSINLKWYINSPILSELINLKTLLVHKCELNDDHIDEIVKIPNLTKLDISSNNLYDQAIKLRNLSKLTNLNVGYTQLNNFDIVEIAKINTLQTLNIEWNIIDENNGNNIANLNNLTTLDIGTCELPDNNPWFSKLNKLTNLRINGTQLELNDIIRIGKLTNLISLDISNNDLNNGKISEIFKLTNLTSLNIAETRISSNDVNQIINLTKLRSLNISYNELEPQVIDEIIKLINLTSLNISNNNFNIESINKLSMLNNLTVLEMSKGWRNDWGSLITEPISAMSKLTVLNINGAKITDAGIDNIVKLTNLENLNISNNEITSEGIRKLTKLKRLTELNISSNFFEDPVAAATGLSQLNTLLHLNVYNDNLNDEAIKQLSKLDNLITLDATYNKFTRASYELIRNMSVLGNPSNYYPKFKDL